MVRCVVYLSEMFSILPKKLLTWNLPCDKLQKLDFSDQCPVFELLKDWNGAQNELSLNCLHMLP